MHLEMLDDREAVLHLYRAGTDQVTTVHLIANRQTLVVHLEADELGLSS